MENYTIIREIGKGGMGCVYEATDSHGRLIALKMMSAVAASQPDYKSMFNQEVNALRRLSHPSIVKIVGDPYSDPSGNLFLPMEYIEGNTITQIVRDRGPYSEAEAIQVFVRLLDVFTYIHRNNCIHRDVKPSNVMIRTNGDICVIDFGIAKDSKTSTGKTIGMVVGTDGYMSPEQANGYNIDARTDIYSLGCLLHYMLTGKHAIAKKSNNYETICSILDNDFPKVSDEGIVVSLKTQNAILRAVNKNMTLRFQTVAEFKSALLGHQDICYTVSVGRTHCDVTMEGAYVSGRHLDVIWKPLDEQNSRFNVTIVDHSTNGTGVNGRKIKDEEYSFDVDYSIQDLIRTPEVLPMVMVAGLADCILDWKKILEILFNKMDIPTVIVDTEEKTRKAEVSSEESSGITVPHSEEEMSVVSIVASFVCPIVGWILGYKWRKTYPKKSRTAYKLAWCGFFFNILSNILFVIINS